MNSRDILPVLIQYADLLLPLILTIAGIAGTQVAVVYNAHVKDKRIRDKVDTIVASLEMTIAGSADKKAHAVALVQSAYPAMGAEAAGHLVEAAVYALNAFESQTGYVAPPKEQPTATATTLEPMTLQPITPPVQQVVITHRVEQVPAPTTPPADSAPPALVLPTVTPGEPTPPVASTPG